MYEDDDYKKYDEDKEEDYKGFDNDEPEEYDPKDDRITISCPKCGDDAEYGDDGVHCPNPSCSNYDPD